jgi:hypothetical protein
LVVGGTCRANAAIDSDSRDTLAGGAVADGALVTADIRAAACHANPRGRTHRKILVDIDLRTPVAAKAVAAIVRAAAAIHTEKGLTTELVTDSAAGTGQLTQTRAILRAIAVYAGRETQWAADRRAV